MLRAKLATVVVKIWNTKSTNSCDIFGDSEIEEVHSIGMTEDSL